MVSLRDLAEEHMAQREMHANALRDFAEKNRKSEEYHAELNARKLAEIESDVCLYSYEHF